MNLIEDEREAQRALAADLLTELESQNKSALRVGITGAPGAGKSTLIDVLVRELRRRDKTVGIIAVDPSSKKSGGALLGDRLRMRSSSTDAGVFLRSMAARERLGGLSGATRAGVEILASAFDVVFIETVGVGQSESEIVDLVHTLLFVAQPGAGDSIQYMKAGLVEMPDLFVVNKADIGAAAQRTQSELLGGLGISETVSGAWEAPALLASAAEETGIAEVIDAIYEHRTYLEETGGLEPRLAQGRFEWLLTALIERYGSFGIEALGGKQAVSDAFQAEAERSLPALVNRLSGRIEDALRAR
jgi:LAO/AO transport system kinase